MYYILKIISHVMQCFTYSKTISNVIQFTLLIKELTKKKKTNLVGKSLK